jgi:hypothetical protein
MEVMAEIKPGKVLSEGTIVYYWKYNNIDEDPNKCTGYVASSPIHYESDSIYLSYLYEFDVNDGSWATYYVRNLWKSEIRLHPHCTLFDMIYSNLIIKKTTSKLTLQAYTS